MNRFGKSILVFLSGSLAMLGIMTLLYKCHCIRIFVPTPYQEITQLGGSDSSFIEELGAVNLYLESQLRDETAFVFPKRRNEYEIVAFNKNYEKMSYERFREISVLARKKLDDVRLHGIHEK